MTNDDKKSVSKWANIFFIGTFLSRLTGLFRDVSMAYCFGTHPLLASFMVAFRFSHLFRRLFGESALGASFVPHFEKIRKEDPKGGARFFRDLFFSLAVVLIAIVLLLELLLFIIRNNGWGSHDTLEILKLSMSMLPGIVFICLFALNSSLMQCEKKFFLSAISPGVFNIIWISAVFLFHKYDTAKAVSYLANIVSFAYLGQCLATCPSAYKYLKSHLPFKERLVPQLFSHELRVIIKAFAFSVIGIGAVQINGALDTLFARVASLQGPAYLWYAIRIEQLPLALFGIALSTALFPSLTRILQSDKVEEYKELLVFALKRAFFLMCPCMLFLLAGGFSLVNLMYGRGAFGDEQICQTAICLWGYSVSLVPTAFILLMAQAFYARKDYRSPTWASVLSVIFNCMVSFLFVYIFKWGPFSIALATGFAAVFNFWVLMYMLTTKIGSLISPQDLKVFFKIFMSSLITAVLVIWLEKLIFENASLDLLLGKGLVPAPKEGWIKTIHFVFQLGSFLGIFVTTNRLLKLKNILKVDKKRS
ncbi:MAG: murein biosynthesis integral membrane protein MurJ [Rhabdochlamydiaceae bacterium]